MMIGWGFSWALGLGVVFFLDSRLGWILMGGAGGLVTWLALRQARISRRGGHLLAVVIGWVAGGATSSALTNYGIVTGWIAMATIGGTITSLTAFGVKRSRLFAATLLLIGWIVGGIVGAEFTFIGGRVLGP